MIHVFASLVLTLFLNKIYIILYFFSFWLLCNVLESQEEKPVTNGDGGFIINLSKDQKDHYGSQFESDKPEAPDIGELRE